MKGKALPSAAVAFEEIPPSGPLEDFVECFCRIMRLRKLLPQLKMPQEPDWADLALAGGFSDQAHLIHECVALAGVTPRQLWRERAHVGFLQYEASDQR